MLGAALALYSGIAFVIAVLIRVTNGLLPEIPQDSIVELGCSSGQQALILHLHTHGGTYEHGRSVADLDAETHGAL